MFEYLKALMLRFWDQVCLILVGTTSPPLLLPSEDHATKTQAKDCTPPDPGRPPLAPKRVCKADLLYGPYYIDDDLSEFFSEDHADIVMRIAPELGTLNSTKKGQ